MLTVTVDATRSHRVAAHGSLAVEASAVRSGLGFVAGAAIDKLEIFGVPPPLSAGQVRVAVDAGQTCVHGCRAGIFGHEDGDFLFPVVAGNVWSGVAPQALAIFLRQSRARRQQQQSGSGEEPTLPMTTLE